MAAVVADKSDMLLALCGATEQFSYCFRKVMLDYSTAKGRTPLTDTLMSLIRRVEANSSALRVLVKVSLDINSAPYYKLPIGLLLRSCLVDSILGLYLTTKDEATICGLLEDVERDYVRALPDRFEVYTDRVGLSGMDESLLKHIYGLQIEDTFCNQIDWEHIKNDDNDKNMGFFSIKKGPKLTIKSVIDQLKTTPAYVRLSKKLYAYYREYSQYEHFSLYGHSDSLIPYDEDNTSMSKAFLYVCEAMHCIVSHVDSKLQLSLSVYSSHCCEKVLSDAHIE